MIIYLFFCLFTFLGFFVLSGPREKSQKAGRIKTRAHLFGAAWLKGTSAGICGGGEGLRWVIISSWTPQKGIKRATFLHLRICPLLLLLLLLNFLHSIHESVALQLASGLHLALPPAPPHPLTPSAPQTSQFGRSETPDHRCVIINEGCKKKKKRIWRWGAAESVHNHWKKMFSSSLLFPPLHRFVYLFHLSSHQAMNWAPQLDVFKSTCFWCRRWLHRSDPTLRGSKANLYLLITPS